MIKPERIALLPIPQMDVDLCSGLVINSENPESLVCETSSVLPAEHQVGQTITFKTGSKTEINIDAVCDDLTVNALTENGCRNALSGLEESDGVGSLTIFQDGTVSFKSVTPFMGDSENVPLTTLQNELVDNATILTPDLDKQYGLPALAITVLLLTSYGIKAVKQEKRRKREHQRRADVIDGLRRENLKTLPERMAEKAREDENAMNLLLGRPPATGIPLQALGRPEKRATEVKEPTISPETRAAIQTTIQLRKDREKRLAQR